MGTLLKFIARTALTGAVIAFANTYIGGFVLLGGTKTLIISAVILALLMAVVRPILRLITAPLVWITFGFFNIIISMAILWLGDLIIESLAITTLKSLFLVSLLLALINSIF